MTPPAIRAESAKLASWVSGGWAGSSNSSVSSSNRLQSVQVKSATIVHLSASATAAASDSSRGIGSTADAGVSRNGTKAATTAGTSKVASPSSVCSTRLR